MRNHRVGIEIELLTPSGSNRADLAFCIAEKVGGTVVRNWHLDSEPTVHPDLDVFHHLTPAFNVLDADGTLIVRIVEDVTITSDLNAKSPSPDGWSRILSDDQRILRMFRNLIEVGVLEEDVIAEQLQPFGLICEAKPAAIKISDSAGASVAMVARVPGDSPRVAECISPPLTEGIDRWLELVVGTATELGCVRPAEGAIHLHYDAAPFASPLPFQRVVWAFGESHLEIRERFSTNPKCRRLGPLPAELVALVDSPEYLNMPWTEIVEKIRTIKTLTKYADVNLVNLVRRNPATETVEFRMLPVTTNFEEIAAMISSVDGLVDHFIGGQAGLERLDVSC